MQIFLLVAKIKRNVTRYPENRAAIRRCNMSVGYVAHVEVFLIRATFYCAHQLLNSNNEE